MSSFGVVAIGRNEGARLKACLRSVIDQADAVVYVDSGSSDDSVEFAESIGVNVVTIDTSIPFTAARARNAGFAELRRRYPDLDYVQFVDGDCEVVSGWLSKAVETLDQQSQIAVVTGRRRERYPEASIYNRLCDMEWDTPVGEAGACGGDAMFRCTVFDEVGRFNPGLIAGEEPELCVRIRKAGWKILRVDEEMTLHDAAMTRWPQWWKRMERAGHAYAEGASMHGEPPWRHNVRELRSLLFWGLAMPLGAVTAAGLGLTVSPLFFVLLLPWLGLFGLLGFRVVGHRRRHGDSKPRAWLYAGSAVVGKFPLAQGALSFSVNRLRGKRRGLIEYK